MEPVSGIQWNTVTWYSKLIAVVLFVSLVCSAFYFGIWYEKSVFAVRVQDVTPNGLDIDSQTEFARRLKDLSPAEIVQLYQGSRFKVVRIIRFPFEEPHYDALYVVGQRGVNDSGCGSAYGSQTCYFFLESNYYGVQPIKYIGSWDDGIIGFGDGKFKDEHTLSFTASGGDGGAGVNETWELNLNTGSTTRLTRVVTDSQ